jgi:hypothetical protein
MSGKTMEDDHNANDYETETRRQIIDCFRTKKLDWNEVSMVLVTGHGTFT